MSGLRPPSLRVQFIAGLLVLLLTLFVLVSFNTTRVLESVGMANLRTTIHQTSETLNLAVSFHTTAERLPGLEDYLNALVTGEEAGVVYLALLDDEGRVLSRTRNIPTPLPEPVSELSELPSTGVVHVGQPILLADNRVGALRYGLASGFLQEANRRILRENLQLMAIQVVVALALSILFGLRVDAYFRSLAQASRALAQGDRQAHAPEQGPREFVELAQDFNRMASTVTRAQEELEREHAFRQRIIESVPGSLTVIDGTSGRFLLWNKQTLAVLGLDPEQIGARRALDIFDPRDQPQIAAAIQQVFATGVASVEARIITADGRAIPYHINGVRFDFDDRPGLIAIGLDISEQKRSEAELAGYRHNLEQLVAERTADLEKSNDQLAHTQFAMDRVGIGLSWNDPQTGRFLYVNDEAVRQLGYTQDELSLMSIKDINPEFPLDTVRQVGRGPRGIKFETQHRRKDGGTYPVEVNVYSSQATGRAWFITFFRDITDRKQAEAELIQAKETAEAATQAKSAFLANMSHEIRTPMNGIIGLTHLLKKAAPTPEQADRLDKIDAAARHLLSVINDILDISKIEAGKLVLEQADFSLHEVLDQVSSLIGDAARAKGLRVECDHADAPLWLRGDVTRLRQALLNYANNAVKFTRTGSIQLRARQVDEQDGRLLLRFEVQDTGIGIDPDTLSRLFQAFEQADTSTTRRYGGTGLGLAINRHIARLMGGDAGAASVPGQGSTFWLSAWLDRGQPTRTEPSRAASSLGELRRHHGGAVVLMVEDNPINREVALDLLLGAGLRVDTAENGRIAVEKVRATGYDLVLMDMQMPEMDGLQATRIIRTLPGRANLPILALTANAFSEDRQSCEDAGMSDFIAKPVDAHALYSALLKWLPRKPEARTSAPGRNTPPPPGAGTGVSLNAVLLRLARDPGIDLAHGLGLLAGQREKYVALLRQAADLHGDDMRRLRVLFEQGDREGAQKISHNLKGMAANLGILEVAGAAQTLDGVLKAPPTPDDQERVSRLVEAVAQHLDHLRALVAAPPPTSGG